MTDANGVPTGDGLRRRAAGTDPPWLRHALSHAYAVNEVARLAHALGETEAMLEAVLRNPDGWVGLCHWCCAGGWSDEHAPDCLWVRARRLLEADE